MKAKKVVDGDGCFIGIRFNCPGCTERHVLPVTAIPVEMVKSPHYVVGQTPHWHFNGDYDSPTLSPSIHSRTGHYTGVADEFCWCKLCKPDDPAPEDPLETCTNCHFLLREGVIEFLPDCTHALAGKKVPLPEIVDHQAVDA